MKGVKGFVARPLEERFWEKVEKTDGCWLWRGAHDARGYGSIGVGGRRRKATHVSLELAGRPLSPGQMACHRCDNPSCVRPDHLFGGSMSDNIKDCVSKGRHNSQVAIEKFARGDRHGAYTHPEKLARGEEHGQSKLTWDAVREIRALTGKVPQKELARRFSVCRCTIRKVQNGSQWKESA